jgi:hypothetical protein
MFKNVLKLQERKTQLFVLRHLGVVIAYRMVFNRQSKPKSGV